MKPIISILLFTLLVGAPASQAHTPHTPRCSSPCELRSDMRKLWEDHVTWTRVFIISALAGLPDRDAATKRLLRNQKDIGDTMASFYGKKAGDDLTDLLTTHILIAAEIVDSAKAGRDISNAVRRWYDNADQIAAFLHGANPWNWALADMKKMMRDHLKLTTDELTARLLGNWEADVVAYDKLHEEILMMADDLASGLIKQFCRKHQHHANCSHSKEKEEVEDKK